jgi:hypothetical protein
MVTEPLAQLVLQISLVGAAGGADLNAAAISFSARVDFVLNWW